MKVLKAFSKFAHEYYNYNVIQKEVARELCSLLEKKDYRNILDVGAGDGEVYKNLMREEIKIKTFVALDFSKEMLDIHPEADNIQKKCLDFNSLEFTTLFKENEFDLLISSSALQWSSTLPTVLRTLSHISKQFYFSFFTSNTFKTLHQVANISSPIYSVDEICEALDDVFEYEIELVTYKLDFDSVHKMLQYIKKSGVSGGVKQLSYRQIKLLMLNYPLDYLEFEVVFIKGKRKK